MLEREYQYYLDSRNESLNQYDGKHLVIVGILLRGHTNRGEWRK